MVAVGLQVNAGGAALGLAGWAAELACSLDAKFALLAGFVAGAAVAWVVGQADAKLTAFGLALRATDRGTFAVEAVLSSLARCDFRIVPLPAAFGVSLAGFKGSRNGVGVGHACGLAFFARGFGAVGDTRSVVATFSFGADCSSFARSPRQIVGAQLGAFFAGFGVVRLAGARGVGFADLTAVVYAKGLVVCGAMFVGHTLHTGTCRVAVRSLRAVFVASTKASVSFCVATFGRAYITATLFIIDAGDALGFSVDCCATIGALHTARLRNIHFSGAAHGEQQS